MGFIERLRQQKASELELELKREKELRSLQKASADKIAKIREQTRAYFDNSGVESLVTDLAKITGGYCRGYPALDTFPRWGQKMFVVNLIESVGKQGFNTWIKPDYQDFSLGRLPSLAKDVYSVSYGIVWDKKAIAREDNKEGQGWTVYEGKFFEVETQPDGTIVFHAGIDIPVALSEWSKPSVGRAVLESTLEQAYFNPIIQRYNVDFNSVR